MRTEEQGKVEEAGRIEQEVDVALAEIRAITEKWNAAAEARKKGESK